MKDFQKKINNIYNKDINSFKYRNNFHFDAPFGLINDPNGLAYYNGYYHIFFQWHLEDVKHGLKRWGHIKTKDFINYTKPKVALQPNNEYDKNGCYSGSTIKKTEDLYLFYTGNVINRENNRESNQCLAILNKDGNITKKGKVISEVAPGYSEHYRDPYVFKKDNNYFMLIGAQNLHKQGRIVIYKSDDLKEWKFKSELDLDLNDFGYMWECPNYINFKEHDLIIFSPQGLKKEEFKYQNLYQSGYVMGKLDLKENRFKHDGFKELDYGFDFYAPQVFKDNKDRVIMIAWMGLPESENKHLSISEGWIHSLTLPKQLIIKNDKLYQRPLEEFKELRKDLFSIEDSLVKDYSHKKLNKNSFEMIIELDRFYSDNFSISLKDDQKSYFKLNYDFNTAIISIKRNSSGEEVEERKLRIEKSDKIKLRIFKDTSTIEIFINDGLYVLSSRLYTDNKCLDFMLEANNKIKIEALKFWSLKGVSYDE